MSLVASANMRLKKKKTASTLVDATAIGGASPSHGKSKPPSPPSSSSSSPSSFRNTTNYNGDDRDDLQQQKNLSPVGGGNANLPRNQTSSLGATTATGTVVSGSGNHGSEGDFARTGGADYEANGINHPWMMLQQQHTVQPPHPLLSPTATAAHHSHIIRHPSPLPVHQQLFQQPHQHFDTAIQQRNVTNYLSPRHPGRAPNRPRRGHDSFIDSPPTGSNKVFVGVKSGNKEFDPTQNQLQFQGHNSQQQEQQQEQQQKPHPQSHRQELAFDPFAPSPLTLPNINTSNITFSNANTSFNSNGRHSTYFPKADANSSYFQKQKLLPMQKSGGETNMLSSNMHIKNSSNTPPMLANHTDFEYHTDNYDDDNDNAADDEVVRADIFHYDNNGRSKDYDNDNEEEGTTNSTSSPKPGSTMMRRMLFDKEDQTIDSERALHGTPVKKKKKELSASNLHHQERHPALVPPALTKGSGSGGKKNRKGGNGHRKKSKVIIDNVDEFTNYQQQQQQQQYQHHHQHLYSEDTVDEGSDVGLGEVQHGRIENKKLIPTPTTTNFDAGGGDATSSTSNSRTNMLDIAAHARKLASDGIILDSFIEINADTAVGTNDDDEDGINTRHYISPRRIGKSKSLDSEDGNNGSSNYTSKNVTIASTIHSLSRKVRDDDDDDDDDDDNNNNNNNNNNSNNNNNNNIINNNSSSSIRIRRERDMFLRTSQSWNDDDGASKQRRLFFNGGSGDDNTEEGNARGGTWEIENASFFGVNSTGGGRGGDSRATNSWDNNFDFSSNSVKNSIRTSGGTSRRQQGSLSRASKSWDDDGISDQRRIGSDEGIARWGTWGDEHVSLFGVGSAAYDTDDHLGVKVCGKGGGKGQVMSSDKESLTDREHDTDNSLSENFNMLEEWDKAEAKFRETISADSKKAGSPLPSLHQQGREQKNDQISPRTNANKSRPWSSDEQSMVFEGLDSRSSISRDLRARSFDVEKSNSILSTDEGDDDDDSIFAFGTKDHAQSQKLQELPVTAEAALVEKHRLQSSPSVHNPADIFKKIKSGLKQADKTKNRALGIQGTESDGSCDPSDTSNDVRRADDKSALASLELEPSTIQTPSEFHDVMMTKEEKMSPRITFATDTQNTVHTYRAESEEDLSEIDKFDFVDDEDRKRSVGNNKTIKSNSARSEKIVESNKSTPFRQPENDNLQEGSDNDTYGDSTVEDSMTYKSGLSDDLRKVELDELNLTILDHVDNAVTAVAATLGGLFGLGSSPKQPPHNENTGHSGASSADDRRLIATEDDATTYDTDTYGESTAFTTLNNGMTRTDGSEYDWLDYMRSFIFPQDLDGDTSVVSGHSKDDESTFPEDEDSFMFQQALAAARAIHHVQGIEFDETQDINVLTDVKFLVVTVALPLGLLFQEHEIGVWVSQAIPGGNGAEKGVQHGDQLAAVNGNSSVHNTLDDVATKINSTPSNSAVELTFLRYVGPLRPIPGSIIQQGFEVTDKSVLPQRKSLPSFLKKKRSGDMSESPKRSALQSKSEPFIARKAAARAAVASSLVASPSRTKTSVAVATVSSSPSQTNKRKISLGKLLSFKRKT